MKNQTSIKKYAQGIFFSLCLLLSGSAFSQQTLKTISGWNAYVHLPWDYAAHPEKTYPTIIFIPGLGEIGTNPAALISNGPGAYINQGWNGNVSVGSDSVKFIVISLQPPAAWPASSLVKARIDEIRRLYRTGDLYMTGLSMGGNTSLEYSYTYPDEVKAVVGVESVVPSEGTGTDYEQRIYDTYKTPAVAGQSFLLFEQKNDWRRNSQVVDAMNFWVPGSAFYQYTAFNGGGHCCWEKFYGGNSNIPTKFSVSGQDMDLYEWIARNPQDTKGTVPVTIATINAQTTDDAVDIHWSTATESKSNYFEIQRSSDGANYKYVGKVFAKGNSNTLLQYDFRDETPLKGSNFYRLKMVDLDGSSAYSKVVVADVKNVADMRIQTISLNRNNNRLQLNVNCPDNLKAQFVITDINGRTFYRQEKQLIQGINYISEKVFIPATGIYYLRISTENGLITKPLFSE